MTKCCLPTHHDAKEFSKMGLRDSFSLCSNLRSPSLPGWTVGKESFVFQDEEKESQLYVKVPVFILFHVCGRLPFILKGLFPPSISTGS